MTPNVFRDPRRYFTPAQRAEISARQHHRCAYCKEELNGEWDAHHVKRWEHGGRTETDNGIGLCKPCHASAELVIDAGFVPRQWQDLAFTKIIEPLMAGRFATLDVAPGGGKTPFTGWLARTLLERGIIDRVSVAVPYTHLCEQWHESLADLFGVHLGINVASERRKEHGVVVTYQSLLSHADQLLADTREARTLWVLDEVHHLAVDQSGNAGAWARAIERIVGQYDNPKSPVLNLTGTLFRSKKGERIRTIRYDPLPGDLIEATADYTISAGELIGQGVLRQLRVHGFDQDMQVTGLDPHDDAFSQARSIRAVDLDSLHRQHRNAVLAAMIHDHDYIDGMLRQTLAYLQEATLMLGAGSTVKGLVIADDQDHARLVHARLAGLGHGDVSYVAISDDSEADENIRRFRHQTRPAILVAVQKVTEGFDVPDVAVLTYLNTWTAPLFINQMVGRAMRVTEREREIGRPIPATILIPDDPQMRQAFGDVLVGPMRILEAPSEPCARCGKQLCTCPLWHRDKQCSYCTFPKYLCICKCKWCGQRQPLCICPEDQCNRCGRIRPCDCPAKRDDVTVELLSEPALTSSNVNGHQIQDMRIRDALVTRLTAAGQSAIQADACAAVIEQLRADDPWTFRIDNEETI